MNIYNSWKLQEMFLIAQNAPDREKDPVKFGNYIQSTLTMYEATARDLYSLVHTMLSPEEEDK